MTPNSPCPDDAGIDSTPLSGVVHVRLFGDFGLVADGAPVAIGRKGRALLAFLIAADGEAVSRDRLKTLLWSRRGEDQARASLRQTLYEMRTLTTGDDPVVIMDRTRLRIDPARIATDADRIRRMVAAPDAGGLLEFVGGGKCTFLADLDGIDPAFDEWLFAVRTQRQDALREVILDAARHALQDDRAAQALQLANALLAEEPTGESAARLAMLACHRQDDQDGVRRIFARLRTVLHDDLGVAPSEESAATYLRCIGPNRSPAIRMDERHDAEGHPSGSADDAGRPPRGEMADASAEPGAPAGPRRRRWPIVAAACASIALVGAALLLSQRATFQKDSQRLLLVAPLRTAPADLGAHALGVGWSTGFARMLFANDPTLDVAEPAGPLPSSPSQRFILQSDAETDGDRLRANVILLRAGTHDLLWSRTFSRPVGEVDAFREEIASQVSDVAICAVGKNNRDVGRFTLEALRSLFAACEHEHVDAVEEVRLLKRVVSLQPDFGRGWSMLARAAALESDPAAADTASTVTEIRTWIEHALAADPHDGEAYAAQAALLGGRSVWPRRMAVLKQGHVLDPGNANIDFAMAVTEADVGRWRDAVASIQQAVTLDPFDPDKAAAQIEYAGFGGDLPAATNLLTAARRRFPDNRNVALNDFRYSALVGDWRHADDLLKNPGRGFNLQPLRAAMWSALIAARARPSPEHDADAYRAFQASNLLFGGIDTYLLETFVAMKHVDEAYEAASRMEVTQDAQFEDDTGVLFRTTMQSFRADPRFMTFANRLGLVDAWIRTDRWPDFCTDHSVDYDCRVEAARAISANARPLVLRGVH